MAFSQVEPASDGPGSHSDYAGNRTVARAEPNTNSFFGPGGYSVWASDNNALKVRGCIIISSGLGSDISKCLDMSFDMSFQ